MPRMSLLCVGWVQAQPKGSNRAKDKANTKGIDQSAPSFDTGEELLLSFLRGCILGYINHEIRRHASDPLATIKGVNGAPLRLFLRKRANRKASIKFETSEVRFPQYTAPHARNLSVRDVPAIVMRLKSDLEANVDFAVNGANKAIANVTRMLHAWCKRTQQTDIWDNAPKRASSAFAKAREPISGSTSDAEDDHTDSMDESEDVEKRPRRGKTAKPPQPPRRFKRLKAAAQVATVAVHHGGVHPGAELPLVMQQYFDSLGKDGVSSRESWEAWCRDNQRKG